VWLAYLMAGSTGVQKAVLREHTLAARRAACSVARSAWWWAVRTDTSSAALTAGQTGATRVALRDPRWAERSGGLKAVHWEPMKAGAWGGRLAESKEPLMVVPKVSH
jgi:hypothetical protein